MWDRSGSLDSIVSEASPFLRTRNELEAPDIEVVRLAVAAVQAADLLLHPTWWPPYSHN
ncbi:hypothetical protein [Streptomyces sp. BF23-18]|uniref:hypothetical protein n=1 Tax=unclassified Streptomyces TaxID=2593676 RepID=UPI0034E37B5A